MSPPARGSFGTSGGLGATTRALVNTVALVRLGGTLGKLAAPVCVLIGVMLSGVWAQTPPVSSDQQYLFIDGQSTRSRLTRTVNLSRVRERLTDAGDKGYGVHFVARFSSSVNCSSSVMAAGRAAIGWSPRLERGRF